MSRTVGNKSFIIICPAIATRLTWVVNFGTTILMCVFGLRQADQSTVGAGDGVIIERAAHFHARQQCSRHCVRSMALIIVVIIVADIVASIAC